MKYAEHIVDLVGNTPLVKLNSVTDGIAATVLAKVEYMNPGGSVKDRIALKMVEAAEASATDGTWHLVAAPGSEESPEHAAGMEHTRRLSGQG